MLEDDAQEDPKSPLERYWRQLVSFCKLHGLQQDTRELNWYARVAILALPFFFSVVFFYIQADPFELLMPQGLIAKDTNVALARTLVITAYSLPTLIGLWVIRTHDKKVEFRNHQEQMSNHQKQLDRSQSDKAVDLLAGDDPTARGLGASRLTDLFIKGRIDKDEYFGYLAICKSWEGERTMVAHRAHLPRANLQEVCLGRADLSEANLQGANLQVIKLKGANLREANLEGSDLGEADLEGADLEGANLSRANLSRAKLQEAYLSRANLEGANLSGANLERARLSGITPEQALPSVSRVSGITPEQARLLGANLEGPRLSRVEPEQAFLFRGNLEGARLSGGEPAEARLLGANLEGTLVDGCEMTASQKQLFKKQGVNVESVIVVDISGSKSD